jgi:hypothetical protein
MAAREGISAASNEWAWRAAAEGGKVAFLLFVAHFTVRSVTSGSLWRRFAHNMDKCPGLTKYRCGYRCRQRPGP